MRTDITTDVLVVGARAIGASTAYHLAACDEIDTDPAIGVAVITGAGSAFCSGADTAVLQGLRSARPDEVYHGLDALYSAFQRIARLRVPSVAAVNGAAVGAGANLALCTDLRLMSETAVLVSGFARVGLHPGGGHLTLLARAGGAGLASAAGVFAQPVDADPALARALATRPTREN